MGTNAQPTRAERTITMKKLRMKDVFTREAYDGLTAEERRHQLKIEQAKECSGLRRYPTTCAAVLDRIPAEWLFYYTAYLIVQVMQLIKDAYDDGKNG